MKIILNKMEKPILKDNHTLQDVKQYLDELKIYEKVQEKNNLPQPLDNPDFSNLIGTCKDFVIFINSEDFHEDNDYKHFIYEAALDAVFGDKFWKFKNSRS